MAYVHIVLTYHKQSDLFQNQTQLLQLLCQVTWYYPHQGSFSEVELFFIFIFIYLFSHSQNLIQHEQKLLIKL